MKNCSSSNLKSFWGKDYALKIFLALVLAVSLLFSIVNVTGAWFTDSSADKKTINTVIKTGEANLNVYQEDSAGTQTLLSKSLPTGYTQLEYIESTGTQYIDTGYYANPKTKIQVDFAYTKLTQQQRIFGHSYDSDDGSGLTFCCYISGGDVISYASKDGGGEWSWSTVTASKDRIVVTMDAVTSKITITGDNANFSGAMNAFTRTSTVSLSLFKDNGRHSVSMNSSAKIYSSKIWNGGSLVRNLVPAKNSSGTIGMYDLVEDKFYTNQGTGTFTAGAEQISGAGVSLAYNTTNKTNNKVNIVDSPAEYTQLKLLLKNEDLGSSFGIRYKVNFYATTLNGKVLLTSSIAGMTAPTSSTNGFVYNSTDGYYYYKNSSGQNVMFEPATSTAVTSKYLMQSFSIEFSSVANLLGGNSIYMEILVESVNV